MNIGQVIQMIRDLIAAANSGNWLAAFGLLMKIIEAIGSAFPAQLAGAPRTGMTAAPDLSTKTVDELLADLETCCNAHQPVLTKAPVAVSAAPTGPFIVVVLPILLALLKKWLGV